MAIVRAFNAIRPAEALANKVAALPYDVMDTEEARKMVEGNQYSFLHVDRAEIDLDRDIDSYDTKVYEKAKANLNKMVEDGVLIKDEKPNLYIYSQIMNGRKQTGIVCCTAIDDYINDNIKKHEYTREDKEKDRINHVDYCNANTGPIFLTYRHNNEIDEIVLQETKKEPLYNFTTEDEISHAIWKIDNGFVVEKLVELFKGVESFYIADGHHRAASAVKVGLMRREQKGIYTGEEEFNFFLSVIFPDKDLKILDYNRVIKDLNGLSKDEFISRVSEKFEIEKVNDKNSYKPEHRHTFGMYLDNEWYKLKAKNESFDESNSVASLDVSILQDNLLSPILNIKDPRTDKRIDFVGGIRGLKELERRVKDGMKLAFSMYPTTIAELIKIADESKVMPPKSTWFEPKIRCGLFIHSLEDK